MIFILFYILNINIPFLRIDTVSNLTGQVVSRCAGSKEQGARRRGEI